MNQTTALTIIALAGMSADSLGLRFGGAGGGPGDVRDAIDALGVYETVNAETDKFARSFLHLHFDTGINLNRWDGAKEWLDTIFVDFDQISVPGGW